MITAIVMLIWEKIPVKKDETFVVIFMGVISIYSIFIAMQIDYHILRILVNL